MARLAIKGHETRGAEVIEILEMLGGINVNNLYGDDTYDYYTITDNKEIDAVIFIYSDDEACIFTLEEFLEKFPYKVGDKVIIKVNNQEAIIDKAIWCCDTIIYWLKYDDCLEGNWRTEHLQPYKEETMEERQYKELRMPSDDDDKLATEATIDGDKITPPNNYLIGKITKVDNGMLVEFVKKQPQYPKTYEECCKIIHSDPKFYIDTHLYSDALEALYKLLICRDAYWKIAGEQMGLGKPWVPDWAMYSGLKHCIIYSDNEIKWRCKSFVTEAKILAFPTEEMRDAFFENFKDLIKECKELL